MIALLNFRHKKNRFIKSCLTKSFQTSFSQQTTNENPTKKLSESFNNKKFINPFSTASAKNFIQEK
jgi:hypothetical protein